MNFNDKQLAALAAIDDSVLAEETRDMFVGRQFRRDVFVKGRVALDPARQRALWLDRRFVLTVPPEAFALEFNTSLGKMQLRPEIHGALIEALKAGPTTLRQTLARNPDAAQHWTSLVDALKILVGRGDVSPALPEVDDAARARNVRGLNEAVLARATASNALTHLASPLTGGGVLVERLAQLYLLARGRGGADPAAEIAKLAEASAPREADGAEATPEAARAYGAEQASRIETRVAPMLARLGIG